MLTMEQVVDSLTMIRVALYPRVSSKKQVEEGDSIDSQISRLKNFCQDKGYEIIKIYTDAGRSASIDEDKITIVNTGESLKVGFELNKRPAFKEMLEDAKKGLFQGLVFFKWDRFSRNVIFAELSRIYLERLGIELIPTDDDKDPLIRGIRSQLNQDEVRKIKERVRLNRLKKFEDSVMVSKSPFGYKWSKVKKQFLIDDKKADIVKQIFQMTSEGKGYNEICSEFKLKPQSYYNILKNKVYIGYIEFEGKIKKGKHPPIISEELFNKCQKK